MACDRKRPGDEKADALIAGHLPKLLTNAVCQCVLALCQFVLATE